MRWPNGLLALLTAATLLMASAAVVGYPEPAAVNPSWQLDFSATPPQPIAVQDVGGRTRWYWYITYKVVNNTPQDRMFIPDITIGTEQGDIVPAGRDVPAEVFAAIEQREGNRLLESPTQIVGRLLQGEDYAKESVAVWPDFGTGVHEVRVFVSGLSGETAQVHNPVTGQAVLMRKTLMSVYQLPGNPPSPQQQGVVPVEQVWVMR